MTIGIGWGGEKGAVESLRVPFIPQFVNLQNPSNIKIKATEKAFGVRFCIYRKLFLLREKKK